MASFLPQPLPSFPLYWFFFPPLQQFTSAIKSLLRLHQVIASNLKLPWFPLDKLKGTRIQVVSMHMQEQLGAISGRVPRPCVTPMAVLGN